MMQGSLAMRLRVLRAERGLSLTEAAERAGIQRQTLALLERGERHPHDPTLAKIAQGYGVPVEDLLEEPVPLAEAPDTGLTGQAEAAKLHGPNLQGWLSLVSDLFTRWTPQIVHHEGAMATDAPTTVRVEQRGRAMTWGMEIGQIYRNLVDGILADPLFPGAYRPDEVLRLHRGLESLKVLVNRTDRWYEGDAKAEVVDLQARRASDERLREKLAPLIGPHEGASARLRGA